MYYYKARIYSPTLGRFLQTDPIGYEDQYNLYAYVGNDPINGVDPLGLYKCSASAEDCAEFDAAFEQVKRVASRPIIGTRLRDRRLGKVVDRLEETGENEITVTFSNESDAAAGASFNSSTNTLNVDRKRVNDTADELNKGSGRSQPGARRLVLAGFIVHEGTHALQRKSGRSLAAQGRDLYFREVLAYDVQLSFHFQTNSVDLFGDTNLDRRATLSCLSSAFERFPNSRNNLNQFESGCHGP